jgi:cell division protease FtsH
MSELQEAIERVMMGPERKSRLISAKEKRIIAYREAGAALVSHFLPHCNPIRKITIVSRGSNTGYVFSSPADDNFMRRRSKFMHEMAAMLAGRITEQTIFGTATDGAAHRLERASASARAMVTQYGMSERLGPMVFGERDEMIFLGREISEQRNYSEDVAELIDDEVRAIIEEASQLAQSVIDTHRADLEVVAKALMDKETLTRDEFIAVLEGHTSPPPASRPPQRTPQPKATPSEGDGGLTDGDISFSPAPA